MPDDSSTFRSIFFPDNIAVAVQVPDYQRAFAWEEKQTSLFLSDLRKHHAHTGKYYFGHFIVEESGARWEIVDGQQRLTTFVLFLMICRVLSPGGDRTIAYQMIERFRTVSYDADALASIGLHLPAFLTAHGDSSLSGRKEITDGQIRTTLSLTSNFTRSQRRIVMTLLRFYQAFRKGDLQQKKIPAYIDVIMESHCSHHLTKDKSVAVNIFEMHNTRGIPLSTVEVVKAQLMKFVHDHGGTQRTDYVEEIQAEFGEIYRMEELLEERTFRGKLSLEQILRLHLKVVDDGTKRIAGEFDSPAPGTEALLKYLDERLHYEDADRKLPKDLAKGVAYALAFAREFKRSVRLVSDFLPTWDLQDELVGDVLILDRDLSCQFFLLACRSPSSTQPGLQSGSPVDSFQTLAPDVLRLWERLVFTRDFHDRYYRLKYGDNFVYLFEEICRDDAHPGKILLKYVKDGFRGHDGITRDLQTIVATYLEDNRRQLLTNAYYWPGRRDKVIYAIYKYERERGANLRGVLKESISLDHILPQEWRWDWITNEDLSPKTLSDADRETLLKKMGSCINGIGNLLLITPSENSSFGSAHPADKEYHEKYAGGTYQAHRQNREEWRDSAQWENLILERGKGRVDFIIASMVGIPAGLPADFHD